MAKRMPARRKREREWTHDQMLRVADLIEARGDKEKADLIRKLAKDRFRAIMTYGQKRRFTRILWTRRSSRCHLRSRSRS